MLLLLASSLSTTAPSAAMLTVDETPHSSHPTDTRRRQQRIAEITEMIHVASLLHDDVIDNAETRRGLKALNSVMGNKVRALCCFAAFPRICPFFPPWWSGVAAVVFVWFCCMSAVQPDSKLKALHSVQGGEQPLEALWSVGMQVAILAGDFLLARASMSLAALHNTEVIVLLSQVIEHLVSGEILQVRAQHV